MRVEKEFLFAWEEFVLLADMLFLVVLLTLVGILVTLKEGAFLDLDFNWYSAGCSKLFSMSFSSVEKWTSRGLLAVFRL